MKPKSQHSNKHSWSILLAVIALCGFAPSLIAQNNADCVSAFEVCKKQLYQFPSPKGEGNNRNEADFLHCFMGGVSLGQGEHNSTWLKMEVTQSGNLGFTITPYLANDDIDFVVFKLPADGNCAMKQIVRCMAAGPNRGEGLPSSTPCMGQTGLRDGETDSSEDAGCNDVGDNAWLAPIKAVKGEKYVILVSNESGPRGWSISLTGTVRLGCEKPPIAEKPPVKKPEKKTEAKTIPPVPVPAPKKEVAKTVPQEIGGRKVEVGETVKVKARTITVKIWDSQVEDGDVVSLYLDDKKILDHYYLRIQPKEFVFELPEGKEHYLTIFADDFGKAEPNTARITINDGVKEQTIDLTAERKKQESVKIIAE